MKTLALATFILVVCQVWGKQIHKEEVENAVRQGDEQTRINSHQDVRKHPCAAHHCGQGHECDIDENEEPVCVCTRKCQHNEGVIKACSTLNATFESECELYRQKCLCHQNSEQCIDSRYKAGHLDYYGTCKELAPCTEEQMEEFPRRMRNWLYLVMEEMDRRQDLPEGAHQLAEDAKKDNTKPWVLPVIWKFCDLDKSHDMEVDAKELMPITAPLKALEHCTSPFMEKCDANANGNISLEEWGSCLGLDTSEIEDRCEDLRN